MQATSQRRYMLLCMLATLLVHSCAGNYLHGPVYSSHDCSDAALWYDGYLPSSCRPTITVLAEQPFSVEKTISPVPLLAVPQDRLKLVQEVSAHPAVSLQGSALPQKFDGALPAVRVFLHRPMMVSSPESVIPFPSGFTVVHDGLPTPLVVSAVIAPLPQGAFVSSDHPVAIRVVYAVSVSTLPVQAPFQQPYPNRRPVSVIPALPTRPQQTIPEHSNLGVEGAQPGGGDVLVTVLDFPTSVASPSVTFFPQISLDEDSELGNREPPQAAVPAGIVQSTAPLPNLSVFVNSKESSVLQTLRDEAERNKAQQQGVKPSTTPPSVPEILYN